MSSTHSFSTGIDIVSITRVGLASKNPRFLSRIYTAKEFEYGSALTKPSRFFATLFAAKEATSKALGTGIGTRFAFTDIEVAIEKLSSGYERSTLELYNGAAVELADRSLFLSCSCSKDLAVAKVLITAACTAL